MRSPVATSHSRTVPSSLPVASVLPSGLNATDHTEPVWPVSGGADAGWPVATSHSRTVPSSLPVASSRAVGAERHRRDRRRCGR